MLKVVDIEYIRKKYFVEHWSIRKISRQLDVSRQSVRKALKSAEPWKYTLRGPKPYPVMDPYREIIIGWLKADKFEKRKQRHTAKRIWERLRDEYQFSGAQSTVRRFVRKLRQELEGPKLEPMFILRADPGEMAQVDWGPATVKINGERVTVHLFCMRLRHSGVPFVWAFSHERMEAFLEGHVRAFDWFGGVPEKLVYDNLSTAVRKMLTGHERELQERFIVLRSHYLFESVFCNPDSGHEKGSVENLVGYAQRNALTPVPEVSSMEELNQILVAWCEKERSRLEEAWQEERDGLRAIPEGSFKPCVSRFCGVNKLSLITCERNRYSVPTEYIGQILRVDIYTDRLEIWHFERLVAEHRRRHGRNQTSLKLEHFLKALARKPYAVTHAAVVRELPEPYQKARQLLYRRDPSGYREMVRILLLHQEFPADQVRDALERALTNGRLSAEEIRQDLLNQTTPLEANGTSVVPENLARIEVAVGDPRCYDRLLGVSA